VTLCVIENRVIETGSGQKEFGPVIRPYILIVIAEIALYSQHAYAKVRIIQGAYKLSEDFAKPYFHKYWTEIHYITTIWKRNVCSFIVTLNTFDVCPTCDTAYVQAILQFPPNPLKHVLCDVPDGSSDYRTIPNVTFTVCNLHESHDLTTLPTQVMA